MYKRIIDTENDGKEPQSSGRWGKPYNDRRNLQQYNEELVIIGMMIFDMDFWDQLESELKNMNMGRGGNKYLFPESIMSLMMIWFWYLDYCGLKGMASLLVDVGIIPYYEDYTTVCL